MSLASKKESAPARLCRWREDPISFVRECLQAEPDPWQKDVLIDFAQSQRIGMKACKGPGKTTVLAWCAWNFLATRPFPKIVATSISADNLSDGLWTEMSKWQSKSLFLTKSFTWNKTRIFCNSDEEQHWMSARTWSKSGDKQAQANTLAGVHADRVLFILDECGDIPDSVMAAAEAALASGIETKLLIAGNPTNLSGPLYRAATTERALWKLHEVTGDPDDPKRSPRVSIEWARAQIEKYGRDNPWVLVNVFGKFPPSSINTLLGPDEVSAAMGRHLSRDQYDFSQKRIGIDVARFGSDATVLFPRQGLAARVPVEMRNARSNDIAARIIAAKAKWGSELEFIDDTGGFGSGVIDSMIQAGHSPQAISFAGKAIDPRYLNKRAEMWFLMAEWIKRGGALPNIPELARELTTPTYTFMNGKFQLESKDQIKERLGYSPDYADALCLTFALPEMPRTEWLPGVFSKTNKMKHEWDPFANA